MAKKVILKDLNDIEVLPITRGELVLDASGNPALHSTLFLATDSLPGLMSSEDKYKLDHLEESGPGANNKVAQINTTTDDVYRLLFSETADDTDRTEKSRKSANLTFNPSTGVLNLTGAINANEGTINGALTIKTYSYPLIAFKKGSTTQGYIGFSSTGIASIWDTAGWRTIWHEGNFNPSNYVPLTGGVEMTGSLSIKTSGTIFTIRSSNGGTPYINFRSDIDGTNTDLGDLGVDTNKNLVYFKGGWKKVWHEGNLKNLSDLNDDIVNGKYLPLSGGVLSGDISFGADGITQNNTGTSTRLPSHIYRNVYDTSGNVYDHYFNQRYTASTNTFANLRVKTSGGMKVLRFGGDGTFTWDGNTVIHSGNIGSQSVGNASTADKLKNKVKIWGLDFDGTKDIDGDFTMANTKSIQGKDSSGVSRTLLSFSSDNNLFIGRGSSGAGYATKVCGYSIQLCTNSDQTERVRISSSGNVGIGTTNPQYKLDVNGSIAGSRIYSKWFGGVNTTDGGLFGDASMLIGSGYSGAVVYSYGTAPIWFHTGSALRMLLDGNGNLGIGTASPQSKLSIYGNIDSFKETGDYSGVIGLNRKATTGGLYNSSYHGFQIHNKKGDLYIFVEKTDSTESTPLIIKGDDSQITIAKSIFSGNSAFGQGRLELSGTTPFIDFHFNESTADYTSRIIEETRGELTCKGRWKVGGSLTANSNLSVAGSSTLKSLSATTGSFSGQITSTVADGTAPLTVVSTTKVENLNADRLDGYDSTDIMRIGTWNTVDNQGGNLIIPFAGKANPINSSEHIYGSVLQWTAYLKSTPGVSNNSWYYLLWGTTSYDRLYFRKRTNTGSWSESRALAFTSDIPTITDYYWANVLISKTSNAKTTPTFGLTKIKGGADIGLDIYTSSGYGRIRFYNASNSNNATIHYFENDYGGYSFAKDTLNLGGLGGITLGSWNNPTVFVTENKNTSDTSGKVGIGTTNPSYKLHVNGTISSPLFYYNLKSASTTPIIYIGANNVDATLLRVYSSATADPANYAGRYGFSVKYLGTGSDDANAFVLYADNKSSTTQNVAIGVDLRGYVGIGTTSPSAPLDIKGEIYTNPYIRFVDNKRYCGYSVNGKYLELYNGVGEVGIHLYDDGNAYVFKSGNKCTIIDSNNYSSILDNRYYTETEVNNKLAGYLPLAGGVMTGKITFKVHSDDSVWIGPSVTDNTSFLEFHVLDDSNDGFKWTTNLYASSGNVAYTMMLLTGSSSKVATLSLTGNMNASGTSNANSFTLNGATTAGTNYITGTAGRIFFGGNFHIDAVGSNHLYLNHYTSYNVYMCSGSSKGSVGIRTAAPLYPLHVAGDTYTSGWSRADSGFYVEGTGVHFTRHGTYILGGEIDLSNGNEFMWGASQASLYFNYRAASRGTTVTSFIWNAGSSSSYASHTMGISSFRGSGKYLKIGPQNDSHAHYETNANSSHWFNTTVDINGTCRPYANKTFNCGESSRRWAAFYSVLGSFSGALTIGEKVSARKATWLKLTTPGHTGSSAWCVGVDDTTDNSYLYMKYNESDTSYFYVRHDGCAFAPHFYESSDQRLKTNIQAILNKDNTPQIKEFDWKESGEHSYGLIAQELEEQGYSELVSTKDDGYKTVNYSAALSLIVGKLQVKIKELEKEIEILKKKN